MARLEQIIDEARALSPAEKCKLRQALDHELDQPSPSQSRATESVWVDQHLDEYLGQWVAVEGDKLVAHGTNPRQVYLSAREAGISVPFIVRVQKREEPSWRGLAVMQQNEVRLGLTPLGLTIRWVPGSSLCAVHRLRS